jgi:hypothetical protein
MYRYVLQPLNLIDLVAIVPFYIELSTDSGSSLSIIRILRLARVIRLIKSGKGRFTKGLNILSNTLVASAPMNAFLLAVALIIFVICGAIGYLLEGGVFRVSEDHPDGAFLRPSRYGTSLRPTPFLSVLHGMYWSVSIAYNIHIVLYVLTIITIQYNTMQYKSVQHEIINS